MGRSAATGCFQHHQGGEYEKTHGIGGGFIFGKVIEARGYKQGQRFKIGFDEKRIVLM